VLIGSVSMRIFFYFRALTYPNLHSTSVESLRTVPVVKKLHEYYGQNGLRVIGVHRPRYEFARSPVLLADAVKRLKIDYPVVNDLKADIAHAYGAQKLDTIFLVNHDNQIVGRKSGREASVGMLSVVCQTLSSKKPGLSCLTSKSVQEELYVHHPKVPLAVRCRAATPDVYVGEARASSLDVGTRCE